MHGESTQALSGEQAVLPGSRQRPVAEVWCLGKALVGSRRTKERTKGALGGPSDRSDCHCHSAPGIQRASVHGYQGTVLKRLVDTQRRMNGWVNQTILSQQQYSLLTHTRVKSGKLDGS